MAGCWARLRAGNRGRARSLLGRQPGRGVADQSCAPTAPWPAGHMRSPGLLLGAAGSFWRPPPRRARPARVHSAQHRPLRPLRGFGRKEEGGITLGGDHTQVPCRQGPRGPSSTYVRTYVQAVPRSLLAVHGANNWETSGACNNGALHSIH